MVFLVGLGVLTYPIKLLVTLILSYRPVLEEGTWKVLTIKQF